MFESIIIMKVGPHSGMNLEKIIQSKLIEERIHGVHYWGYSGVFCMPKQTQQFCKWAKKTYGDYPTLILLETKSAYESNEVGLVKSFSVDGINFKKFDKPVQLQGAKFSFVGTNIREIENFDLSKYLVFGGKNHLLPIKKHLKFRVNKCFAVLNEKQSLSSNCVRALAVDLHEPFAIWLKD